jgi:uncharacterized phage protein (TIGR02218 family)
VRTLPTGLADHLKGQCTTVCRCWKLTRIDGVVLGFSDHDRQLEFDGTTFEGRTGFEASAASSELGLNINVQDLRGILSSTAISEDDLRAGRYDNAQLDHYLVNWSNVDERLLLNSGTMGAITREDGRFRAEFRSIADQLDQVSGRRFTTHCDAALGDGRCGVDLDAGGYKADGLVTRVADALIIEVSGLESFESGWFSSGQMTFSSGANSGLSVEVSRHGLENGVAFLQLWKTMPFDIGTADGFSIIAGCNKLFSTCRTVHDAVALRGEKDSSLKILDQKDLRDVHNPSHPSH